MLQDSRALLEELVRIPSVSGQEKGVANFVVDYLQAGGFSVTKQRVEKDRYNVLAQKGQGESLLLFGHTDTVSEKPGWKTNPYAVTQKGDKLYGLGTWDMKAGVAAILTAATEAAPKNIGLKVAFVVDEEEISLGMHTVVTSGWLDGVYGAISSEPGFTYGLQGIALGRIGRGVYRITVKTDGGHVYLIHERHNAIVEAYKTLNVLQKIKTRQDQFLGESVLFPRLIQGGAASMAIPDEVIFEIESQLVPPQTTDSLLDEMTAIIAKAVERGKINARVTVEKVPRRTPFCNPYTADRDAPFVKDVARVLRQSTAKEPKYYYRRSVADENRVATLGIPVVTVGPQGGNAHEANEWVSSNSLERLTRFFQNFIQDQDTLRTSS